MWASGELGRFIWIVGCTVLIAVPVILHRVRLPRRLQVETIAENDLTEKQKAFCASYDSRLKELGYAPFVTYRLANIPGSKNLLRCYLNSADPVRCVVQLSAAGNGPVQFEQVQFITQYADGSQALTTNRQTSKTFDCEPDKFLQECRGLSDLAELKRRHDQFTEQFRIRGPVFTDTARYFEQVQRRYDKETSHQLQQKLLRLDTAKDQYRVTLRWALRMQRNMFNPLADNLTPVKLVGAFAVGSLPVVVSLWQTQIVHRLDPAWSIQTDPGWFSVLGLSYAVAGVAAGLLFGHKSFVWAFLLAYIPTLLLPSATSHTLGMSLMMGWVADLTFRVYGRRKRVV